MKRLHFKWIPVIIICSTLISCLSTPQKEYEKANELRKKVQKYDLKKYAEEEYKNAEKNYEEAKILVESKKNFKAKKILGIVNNGYQTVLDKGFPPYTDERDNETKKEKKYAEEIKANVAVKEQFEDAEKTYNDALKHKESKEYENSIELLNTAKDKYSKVYSVAKQKKDKAKKSIDSTEHDLKEVEANAIKFKERIKEIMEELEN